MELLRNRSGLGSGKGESVLNKRCLLPGGKGSEYEKIWLIALRVLKGGTRIHIGEFVEKELNV